MGAGVCETGHAIVCGSGHLVSRIADGLRERGCEVVVIEEGFTVDERLELAGVARASCVIAASENDCANLEAAIDSRRMNPTANVIVRLFDQELAGRVETAFGFRALSASYLASPAFVSAATDESVIAMFSVDGCHLSLTLLSPPFVRGEEGGSRLCSPDHGKCEHDGVLVRKDGPDLRVCENVEPGGQALVASVKTPGQSRYARSRHRHRSHSGGILHTLNPARAFRAAVEVWRHATTVAKALFLTFASVALLNVIVFSAFGRMNPLDALYFVTTTMTTVGYGDINLLNAPPGLKLYGVLMMLSGAALLATIYAIIADYVLTARVESLLGRRQVNMADHTVVIGLGNVGYRVARDLAMLDVAVVAVEVREDADNLSAARQAFPVVIGDASRSSILNKAAIDKAATVLAVTNDPMLNLSVALHVREANPIARIVMRTYDAYLADKLRAAGLGEVISTSAIAAPTFVDAAIYPGVQGSFDLDGSDVLVVRHAVTADSPLLGKTVDQIGTELGIAVVLVALEAGTPYRHALPAHTLEAGQTAVILLTRERMAALLTT